MTKIKKLLPQASGSVSIRITSVHRAPTLKYKTVEELAIALGLDPKFYDRLKYSVRRSGRTTRMLLQALFAAQDGIGMVLVRGWNDRYTYDLYKDLLGMADVAGIDPSNISMATTHDLRGRGLSSSAKRVFVDHYAGPGQRE